jgi:DNA replication licensing factor MCM6
VDNEDVQMAGDGTMGDTADESSVPVRVNIAGRQMASRPSGSSSRAGSVVPATEPAPRPKKRMVITHDKYMELQSMVVLYLSEHEQKTGQGLDREELIDWYLEQKEEEMQDIEELEYEKELIVKLLRRLVKVRGLVNNLRFGNNQIIQENYLIEVKGDAQASMLSMDGESQESSAAVDGQNVRVYYLVHPSVDTESSLTSGY